MSDLPAKGAADMDKWKLRIEAAALGISASELLIKLIELAVTHLHEFGASADGSMDHQTQAKQKIEEDLNVEYSFPDPPKRYTPGPPVDWKSLSQLLTKAKQAINPSAEVDAQLESAFDQWVHGLRNSHKEELICAIAEYSDASGQIKLGDIRAETGDATRPFFVGDRIAVCRWYLGVTNLPDIVSKPVRRVAFLKGSDEAFKADEKLLNRLYPDRTVTLQGRADIVNKLFKTSDFDLIHFTGHCREQQAKALGGLELADGTFLRLIEIGQLEAERTFAAAQPFVMLNACASAHSRISV